MKISKKARIESKIDRACCLPTGELSITPYTQAQIVSQALMKKYGSAYTPGNITAICLLQKAYTSVSRNLLRTIPKAQENNLYSYTNIQLGESPVKELFSCYVDEYPSVDLLEGKKTRTQELQAHKNSNGFYKNLFWETIIIRVFNLNPAMAEFSPLVYEKRLITESVYLPFFERVHTYFISTPVKYGGTTKNLIDILLEPAKRHPNSLLEQLKFIVQEWHDLIDPELLDPLLRSMDFLSEEVFSPSFHGVGTPEVHAPDLGFISDEYEAFSQDKGWMAEVVMLAKNSLVWLYQLSQKYERPITRLDQIPNEELDELKKRGFSALWLIGLWERSTASQKIKQRCGNPDAAPSAYSLKGYYIAERMGGYEAMANLRHRCAERGIRLASDMVPNHTGLDSDWMINHPERFLHADYAPFPSYTYESENLLDNSHIGIFIEDHYYNQSDAAVTFKRVNFDTGETSYIYHGNDGTSMPWNDTAQLDYLNPETREAVIQVILDVARNFPIIRFDAAMTLAKKHIQRLWYPKPGDGGAIASRSAYGMSTADFNNAIPQEFWREVVDRVAKEVPDCLLLAEAFWMMEGFFVRTLGMHRVYNSAFMHMLKNEDNQKFRSMIKETIAFDPGILQRYVNFMSNPDEETAVEQFGDGDKYFGVATILATLPGLPMVGHGQFEGYKEKYGMEYHRSYYDEQDNSDLLAAHEQKISPLFHKRSIFAGAHNFAIYDFHTASGVNDAVYAYTNMGNNEERSLTLVNNSYYEAEGTISHGAPIQRVKGEPLFYPEIFNSLGCTSTDNRFLVGFSIQENLHYLWPTDTIAHEGVRFHLRGYESKVLTNFYEVHDTSGVYRKLWETNQGRGIKNIHLVVLMLKMEKSHTQLEALCQQISPKLFRDLLAEKTSVESFFTLIDPLYKTFTTTLCEDLEIDMSQSDLAQQRYKEIIEQLVSLRIFRDTRDFLNTMLTVEPELLNDLFFWALLQPIAEITPHPIGNILITERTRNAYIGDNRSTGLHTAALVSAVLAQGDWYHASSTSKEMLEHIIQKEEAQEYLNIHRYQGKQYYRKESFAPFMFLLDISAMVQHRSDRRAITMTTKEWFKAESQAQYQVPNIVSVL